MSLSSAGSTEQDAQQTGYNRQLTAAPDPWRWAAERTRHMSRRVHWVTVVCAVVLVASSGCGKRSEEQKPSEGGVSTEPARETTQQGLSDEEFMEAFNKHIGNLASKDPAVKAKSTEALRALVKRSPSSVSLLQQAAHSTNPVARIRAIIGLEILSPTPHAPWRRILENGRAFSASEIANLLRAYNVVLGLGAITPHIDITTHLIRTHLGYDESQENALTVKEFVSLYGEPDEIYTDKDKRKWHCYGPMGVAICEDGTKILRGRLLMADTFWAMLYKAAHGEYPRQLKVVGLPNLQIKLPSK